MGQLFPGVDDPTEVPRRAFKKQWLLLAAVPLAAGAWFGWPFVFPETASASSFRSAEWCKAHESTPARFVGTTFVTLGDRGPLDDPLVEIESQRPGGHFAVWVRDPTVVTKGSELGKVSCAVQIQSARPHKIGSQINLIGSVCGYLDAGGRPRVQPDGMIGLVGGKKIPVFCEEGVAPHIQRTLIVPDSSLLAQIVGCLR
jgi:hypothetical protein